MARVLVTGVGGQIGSYISEFLHESGHVVVGVSDKHPGGASPDGSSAEPFRHVQWIDTPLTPETAGAVLEDAGAVDSVIHLAAQSSVGHSWADPLGTFQANATLTIALAAAVADRRSVRFVNASSAEIFGCADEPVQRETTPLRPVSPYAVAKVAAHHYMTMLRTALGVPAINAIIYPAESVRRAPNFVVRKISMGLCEVALGKREFLQLGDLSVVRDFSYAADHARALILLALTAPPDDYVVASGEGHRVSDVVDVVCEHLRLDRSRVVRSDDSLRRAADPPSLVGDASRLRALGWRPSVDFRTLIHMIVDHDLQLLRGRGD